MDERKAAEEFLRALDERHLPAARSNDFSRPSSEEITQPVREALQIAGELEILDLSDESRVRASLRARLLSGESIRWKSSSRSILSWASLTSAARLLAFSALALLLIVGLSWAIRRLLPVYNPAAPLVVKASGTLPAGVLPIQGTATPTLLPVLSPSLAAQPASTEGLLNLQNPTEVSSPTSAPLTYVVQEGDTMIKIATQFGVSVTDLFQLNEIPPYPAYGTLTPGRTLLIPQPNLTFTPTPIPPPTAGETIRIALVDGPVEAPPGDGKTGELYFTLRSVTAPVTRQLARLSLDCLYSQPECVAEMLPGFPEYSDEALSWSPDGEQAVLVDFNSSELLSFDPQDASWRTLLDQFKASMDLALWSPDGAAIATTVQGEDGFSSLLTLIDPHSPQMPGVRSLAPELGGMQIPLGWIDSQTVLFQRFTTEQKGGAGEASLPVLYKVDIHTSQLEQLPVNGAWDWLSDYPALSPERARLALTLSQGERTGLNVFDLSTQQLASLGVHGVRPVWSPDGEWIAFVAPGQTSNAVYRVRPDGSEVQLVYEAPTFPEIFWTPEGGHLLAVVYTNGQDPHSDRTSFVLIDLADGTARTLTLAEEAGQSEFFRPTFRLVENP